MPFLARWCPPRVHFERRSRECTQCGMQVELRDRGQWGVTSALLLRRTDGGAVTVDGHVSVLPACYDVDAYGRRTRADASVGMRLQLHVALANRLNRALVGAAAA